MKKFFENRITKFALALLTIIGNVLFYTWGAPGSGAKYAVEVHPLFYFMIQEIFLVVSGAWIYFGIKNV